MNNGSQLKEPDISDAIFTLSLSIRILNSQCEFSMRQRCQGSLIDSRYTIKWLVWLSHGQSALVHAFWKQTLEHQWEWTVWKDQEYIGPKFFEEMKYIWSLLNQSISSYDLLLRHQFWFHRLWRLEILSLVILWHQHQIWWDEHVIMSLVPKND